MTDKPILFSGPMIRALLDGRKTQTRRVLKPQPDYRGPSGFEDDKEAWGWEDEDGSHVSVLDIKPNGYWAGDRLWVRETWQGLTFGDYRPTKDRVCDLRYAATDPLAESDKDARGYPWRPSIFMPRWASRLTLTVTDVRVQRLQEITLGDICAEGLARSIYEFKPVQRGFDAWKSLWDGLNAGRGYGWDRNPWVVALTFEVAQKNIDDLAEAA
ncbi:hypothetical protein D2T29_12520 [Sinirhodobacter populi]|uniref:Morphogenetic protein n=1 Tax=Paenirhodobacter populi TaxID=2306993 RepID=A0A443KCH6_9RHOB|nr:hypothetical protein [Sinirhodobacter populi]RWR30488.1 hypothetical protein D2T29_12520 [Sinirhodobacter populi]